MLMRVALTLFAPIVVAQPTASATAESLDGQGVNTPLLLEVPNFYDITQVGFLSMALRTNDSMPQLIRNTGETEIVVYEDNPTSFHMYVESSPRAIFDYRVFGATKEVMEKGNIKTSLYGYSKSHFYDFKIENVGMGEYSMEVWFRISNTLGMITPTVRIKVIKRPTQ